MPKATRIAYVAVDDTTDLAPTVLSLQEQGFDFNGPEEMAPWFEAQRVPLAVQPVAQALTALSQEPGEIERIFILCGSANGRLLDVESRILRESLVTYLLAAQDSEGLLVTHPAQYRLLQPEVLGNREHWSKLAKQLLQDIQPALILPLRHSQNVGFAERSLYSNNPAWIDAIEVLSESALSRAQFKNVLAGTQILIQLARTPDVRPAQAILMHHGLPVHVACVETQIEDAVNQVLFQDSPLTPGGTLLVSHPLSLETMQRAVEAGISVVVTTQWDEDTLKQAPSMLTPVLFHLERLLMSHNHLIPMGANAVGLQPSTIDARQVIWQTEQKPTAAQLMDLEIGVAVIENLMDCAAVLVQNQNSLAIASGRVLPMEAVDYCLGRVAGETKDAVCVLTGEVYSEHVFNALIQARVAGVLMVNAGALPMPLRQSLKNLPFFVGTYTETGMSRVLEQAGVRHG